MPVIPSPPRHRALTALLALLASAAVLIAGTASSARASTSQISIMEVGSGPVTSPADTLHALRILGVTTVRLNISWAALVPDPDGHKQPGGFKPTNPASYPGWAPVDDFIVAAKAAGIGIDLDINGKAPQWAMPGYPPITYQGSQYPSASDYQSFVEAVGKRYSGTFTPQGESTPLPRINFWSIWNEPDYVSSLRPQGTGKNDSILTSPRIYRGLVDAAWKGLNATGHGHDKITFGELASRGFPDLKTNPGMWPVVFIRSLYCLDSHYHQLRGTTASQQGCPTTASGSRRFRSQNPILFSASGVSVHPYSRWYPPNREEYYTCKTGLCTSLADIGNLSKALGSAVRAYGSSKKFPIYSTEYGYISSPPKPSYDKKDKAHYVSQTTAADYINWAEYISYKNPSVASYDQYLLYDPVQPTKLNDYGGYASGLLTWNGQQKLSYDAFRLPLFLPKATASSASQRLEVWGAVRATPFAVHDTGTSQTVEIQFERKGSSSFSTLSTVRITNRQGYIDTHLAFPSSGTVRLTYTYPASDMLLAPGTTVYSRYVSVTVR